MWSLKHGPPKKKLTIGVTDSASRRRAPAFTRANDTEYDTFTHEFQARRSRETRSGSPSRARYSGRSLHSPDGRTPSRKDLRNETHVGHADFGASRSRRYRDLCAQIARGTIGVRTPLRGVASRGS